MVQVKEIYRRRFGEDAEKRDKIYKVLCSDFLQRYVPEQAIVLDVGAGYCEFINNIKAGKKIALDINPDARRYANKDVSVIVSSSTSMKKIKNASIDVVFVNNLFEHLTKEDIVKTVREIFRILRKGGKILVIQPNIRYCYRDYWMFFDHITPLDDRSLAEVLEVNGLKVVKKKARFLPYTTKGRLPSSPLLLRIYLKLPFLQCIFGKQAFLCAIKG